MNDTMYMGDASMAKVGDCPDFETFGEDVRAGREAQGISRKALADVLCRFSYIFQFFGYTISIKVQEDTMKAAEKDKSIRTAPKGAWESGIINEEKNHFPKEHLNNITTDLQGNGYPLSQKNRDD